MTMYVFEILGRTPMYATFEDKDDAITCSKLLVQLLYMVGLREEIIVWRENCEGFYDKVGTCKMTDKKNDGGQ